MKSTACSLLFWLLAFSCSFRTEQISGGPESSWSVRMADAVIERFDSLIHYNNPSKVKWQYDIAMLGQAVDKLGYLDIEYSEYLRDYLDYFIGEDGTIKIYKQEDFNLDHINPAKNLLTLYKRTGQDKYYLAIKTFVSHLENQPRTESGGFWHKKIYPWQMWLDGIYMSSPFLAQYSQEFNQSAWFDTVAEQITLIYSRTVDEQTGLLYHAWDETRQQKWANPETGCSPNFWGRAMGWYMMALVDVLDYFPEDHPSCGEIISILSKTSEALLNFRDTETGLWYQIIDKGGENGNYLEASCSCMFTYAFAKGAKKGYLAENYYQVAGKSFDAIVDEFIVMDKDGLPTLTNICGAAGLGGTPYRDGSYDYYVNEKRINNDPKGVAPFILAALELKK